MADSKISDLTALASGHATGDLLPIVDVSDTTQAASGTTKKTTFQALMQNLPDGTVGAPGLSFQADPNTGIRRSGADTMGLVVGGFDAISIGTSTATYLVNIDGSGATSSGWRDGLTPRTADLTLNAFANVGLWYTNTGASGEVILTLPSTAVGRKFLFAVNAAQYLRVKAGTGDTIRDAATVSASAGYIRSNTVGNVLEVTCIAANAWFVTRKIGTWTVDS